MSAEIAIIAVVRFAEWIEDEAPTRLADAEGAKMKEGPLLAGNGERSGPAIGARFSPVV
jgi:hypothetical protein